MLRNSIGLSKVGDAPPATPGVIEADTVAHCGPTFAGEFARTLTMTDLVTGWTENASIRNTAAELLHPTKKPLEYSTTADGRRRRVYDKPATPWQRVLASGILTDEQTTSVAARIEGINPADLTRQINKIQLRLIELSQHKTKAMAASRGLDMTSLKPSIRRLTTTK